MPITDRNAEFYRQSRLRVQDLAKNLTEDQLSVQNKACPDWTVRDTLYHLAGEAKDVSTGNMEHAPGRKWSDRQIAERQGKSIEDTINEWEEFATKLEPMIAVEDRMTFVVADVACHEIDIQAALDLPIDKDSELVTWTATSFTKVMDYKLKQTELGAIKITTKDNEWTAGEGKHEIALEVPNTFELMRGASGRRSLDQIRSWTWSGDPQPYLEHISVFKPRAEALTE